MKIQIKTKLVLWKQILKASLLNKLFPSLLLYFNQDTGSLN